VYTNERDNDFLGIVVRASELMAGGKTKQRKEKEE